MNLLQLKEANGTVETVGKRLEEAVKAHKFGVIVGPDAEEVETEIKAMMDEAAGVSARP